MSVSIRIASAPKPAGSKRPHESPPSKPGSPSDSGTPPPYEPYVSPMTKLAERIMDDHNFTEKDYWEGWKSYHIGAYYYDEGYRQAFFQSKMGFMMDMMYFDDKMTWEALWMTPGYMDVMYQKFISVVDEIMIRRFKLPPFFRKQLLEKYDDDTLDIGHPWCTYYKDLIADEEDATWRADGILSYGPRKRGELTAAGPSARPKAADPESPINLVSSSESSPDKL
jgi:hypothetical protein